MHYLKFFFKNKNSNYLTLITIITLFSAILRFYQLDKLSFWNDEVASAQFFLNHKINFLVNFMFNRDANMIFFNLIIWLSGQFISLSSIGYLRIIPATFSVLSIPVVFLLGRNLSLDKKNANFIGLLASFLVAINAFHIQYAQELRSYSLVFLLTTLSTYFLIKAIDKPEVKIRWLAYSITIILSIYAHFYAVFILIAHLLSLVILIPNKKFRFPYKNVILSTLFIIAIITPLFLIEYAIRNLQVNWIPFPNLNLFFIFFEHITGDEGILLTLLYTSLIVFGLFFAAGKIYKNKYSINSWKLILVIFCFTFPIILPLLISIVKPIFWDRFILLILPYLEIFVTFGVLYLINLKKLMGGRALTILITFVIIYLSLIGVGNYFTSFQKEDIRGVAKYLGNNCMNSLRVYYPYKYMDTFTIYNLAIKSQINIQWDLKKTGRIIFRINTNDLYKLTKKYNSVCFVVSDAPFQHEIDDQIRILWREYFNKNYSHQSLIKFYGFNVRVYSR